jgi:hypothetical protein
MNAVAVSAQQTKVPCIGFPIAESVVPDACAALVSQFHGRVNVVDVENSIIRFSASDALPAETFNQFKFSFPVARVTMFLKSVFVPVILTASVTAISVFAWLSALLARLRLPPPGRKIAGLPAILPGSIFHPVSMSLKLFGTMLADFRDLCFLAHGVSPNRCAHYSTINFDIACRRIEQAYAQPRLFDEPKAKPEQTAML